MGRPFGVISLALIVIIVAIGNGLRLCEAVFFWKVLEEYHAHPLYIAISGGFWLFAAIFIVIGIWQGKTWAWAGTIASATCYGSWYWIDRLVLQVPHGNWPFALVLTILITGLLAQILLSKKTRFYFNSNEKSRN